MNFGTLKDIFAENLVNSYISENKDGKNLYKKFLQIIKESDTLKTAFIVFKNIENKTIDSEVEANEYIKESISLFNQFKEEKSLLSESKKLVSLLEENGIEYKNRDIKPLHENLQNLITTKKNVSTLDKLHESRVNIISWLKSDKNLEESDDSYSRENINLNKFLEIVTEKYNEKYKDSLSEEEKKILKVLRENNIEDVKTLVANLIKENISLVNNHLKEQNDNLTIKSKLLETKDVIYKMKENNDNPKDKVLKLYELKKNLKVS